uniref:Cilia and flagella associated protein 58 n=1 Tax=Oryzias latipes TaxID=8090 RepID=A0A3P9LTT2_ORYLA
MEGQKADDASESVEQFQAVLSELVGGESADKIRGEFEKLTHALKKSQENEKRLRSKCRELNAEVVSSSTKVAAALKLSQEDETTLTSLKRELDKAWKMVDAAHDREKKDSEAIRVLKEEVSKLTQQTVNNRDQHSELFRKVEELTKERDELMAKGEDLRKRLNEAHAAQQELETQRENASQTLAQLQQELQVQQNDISREVRLKEKLDKEVQQLHTDMEAKLGEIKSLSLQVQKAKEEQQRLGLLLKEQRMLNDRSTKELEQMQARKSKLQQEFEQLASTKERLLVDNQQITNELKMREEEVSQMRQEISKLTKTRETVQKKFWQMEEQKADVEVQMEVLKAQTAALEKDLEAAKKQVETEKKAKDELIRERDILSKNVMKAVQSSEKQQNAMKLLELDKRSLEQEISGYQQEAQKQRKIIQQLEKERDRHIDESSSLMQKVQQRMNDVKVKDVEICDWKKKVAEAECKLKQQESLLESVMSERNLYSKSIAEAQDEITELKRKIRTLSNQVSRLKEEISIKHQDCASSQAEHKRLDKENENLREELLSMKLQLEETKKHFDSQRAEQQNLHKIISDNDSEYTRLKGQLQQVTGERDSLGKQLLHRNDERSLLYEKIRIQQSILAKGDFHYKQRLEDIRLLKLEIKRLQCKKSLMDRTMPNTEELRQELIHLQKELIRERVRNSALEEQLKPINIHRWRQLEGGDPGKYLLIQKIQCLQKRLITKTQELEEQELLLQVLTAELRMLDSEMNEYKSENHRLSSELANIKKKYLCQKKLCSEQRTRPKLEQLEPLPQLSSRSHFTGGGFRLDQPVKP